MSFCASSHSIRYREASLAILGLLWLAACATTAEVGEYPNQQKMIGKSKEEVLACAGKPRKDQTRDDVTFLHYYREAPMLEESQPMLKGSFSTVHHGCWATVILTEDRATEVRYRFVPETFDASNDCEEIFEACPQ